MRRGLGAILTCVLAVTVVPVARFAAVAPTVRTVYVTVLDDQRKPVTNLTAEDFGVKEGGRDCAVVSAEPAREKIRLALMVDDPLAGEPVVRVGLANFVQRMHTAAEISLIVIRQRGETVVDYTSDANTLLAGIGNLKLSSLREGSMVAAALHDIARLIEQTKPTRPVIVLVALQMNQVEDNPQIVLDQIARSGAQLWVISSPLAGWSSQVAADGSRQSGGRQIEVRALVPVLDALQQIADDLTSQYLITYTLPDGIRPSNRLSVTTKARGVTLRAPSRISNR